MSSFGIQFKIQNQLIHKFKKAGATSEETAVSFEKAKLSDQEMYWLNYFAGSFLGRIKKTKNHLYYVVNQ